QFFGRVRSGGGLRPWSRGRGARGNRREQAQTEQSCEALETGADPHYWPQPYCNKRSRPFRPGVRKERKEAVGARNCQSGEGLCGTGTAAVTKGGAPRVSCLSPSRLLLPS